MIQIDNRLFLFFNTVKYLKPSQGYYRIVNKIKRELYKKNVIKIHIPDDLNVLSEKEFIVPGIDFNKDYLNRFDVDEILENKFQFINIRHKVSLKEGWHDEKYQHLWRYNFHYFEYLYPLSFEYLNNPVNNKYYQKYKELILSWIENNPFAQGDGWHPYTISLRITNWMSTYNIFLDKIEIDHSFKEKLIKSLYIQYDYLKNNLEKDVLGNHYFENIKALIIGSVFFGEENDQKKYINLMMEQLEEQILDDGMHFELSPMYHKIILEGLIKTTKILKNDPVYSELCEYIQKMITVLYSMEKDFGKTPAFNDSTDGISKDYKSLLETSLKEFDLVPSFTDTLETSGYYIVDQKKYKLIFDCGEISPRYLPAHGHCDALSYELSIDGIPMIINSGTYQYETGEWRNYFRKTKSHNTVTIGDKEQSQFWASFRVANRIRAVQRKKIIYEGINFISGSYHAHHNARHQRIIGLIDEDLILIIDKTDSNMEESVKSYIHLIPGTDIKIDGSLKLEKESKNIEIIPLSVEDISINNGWYSSEFNKKVRNKNIELTKIKESPFFGYLICLNNIDCKIKKTDNIIRIKTEIDNDIIIDLDRLGGLL